MDFDITKANIDKWRELIKKAKPYEESEIFDGSSENDFDQARWQATCARNLLLAFGLSLTDSSDYGNIGK